MKQPETILTITGSDSTGDSGVQADIKTIHSLGGRAVSAMTSITVQNTLGIQQFFDLPARVVEGQIEAVVNDVEPQIVKIGMLRTAEVVDVVVRMLRKYRPRFVVYDPVVRSSRGDLLMASEVVSAVKEQLLPLCSYVVEREEQSVHGRANVFASALCAYLGQGLPLAEAERRAKDYAGKQPCQHNGPSGRSAELYRRFTKAVERFYQRYNDVAFYAEQLNVSVSYLGQVTRRMANRSPKQIIEERLLQQIEQELSAGSLQLKEIAARLGFSSQAHLTRFFRKQRGISPSTFRRRRLAP